MPAPVRDAQYWCKYAESLKSERVQWNLLWEEIRQYYSPWDPPFIGTHLPGSKQGQYMFTSDPMVSLDKFASNTYSMLMPYNQDYFSLEVDDERLMDIRRVREWLQTAEGAVYRAFKRSATFRDGTIMAHRSKSTYGVGPMYVENKGRGNLLYKAQPLCNTYISENAEGETDIVILERKYKARQIKGNWPDARSEALKAALDAGKDETFFDCLHVIAPKKNEDTFDPGHRFISLYILVQDKTILNLYGGSYRGYHENPFIISRQDKDIISPYAYSRPAYVLADVKTRNKFREMILKAMAKWVDPSILVRKGKMLNRFRTGPAAINYVDSDDIRRDIVPFESTAKVDASYFAEDRMKQETDNAFFLGNFDVPHRQRGPNISAREVIAAERSTNRISVPIISREEGEFLAPTILLTLSHLLRDGLIPPPPPEIGGQPLNVKATGPLALDQQKDKIDSFERYMTWVQQLANTKLGQELAEVIDGVDAGMQLARTLDLWPSSYRTKKEVEERIAAREQQEQAMQMLQGAEMAAGAMNKMGMTA